MSNIDQTVEYFPGMDNVVAEALSRFAYPACKAFQDESFPWSESVRKEVKKIIADEISEGRMVGLISGLGEIEKGRLLVVAGQGSRGFAIPPVQIQIITRKGAKTGGDAEPPPYTQSRRPQGW